jgi:hypothetical protein
LCLAATACSGGDDAPAAASTTTTSLAAPRPPTFEVGDLSTLEQCSLITLDEAALLLGGPATFTQQSTMGNAGTCTVQSTTGGLAFLQWNVDPQRIGAATYTSRLADLGRGIQAEASPTGCTPFRDVDLPAEGLGDGAHLLTCGLGARTTIEVIADVGGHLLLLSVTRSSTTGAADGTDLVTQARVLVSRLPR